MQLRNLNLDCALANCLSGSAKPINNADLDKYEYTGYGIQFDFHSDFLFTDGSFGKNVTIFEANMSSSVHVDKKDIIILGERPTQGLDDTALTAEAKHPNNFMQSGKRFVLRLHCKGSNSFLFVKATKVYQSKKRRNKKLHTAFR